MLHFVFCWSLWWIHLGWGTGAHQTPLSLPLQYNKRFMTWDKEGHSPITIMGKTDPGEIGNLKNQLSLGTKETLNTFSRDWCIRSHRFILLPLSCQQPKLPLFIVGSFAGWRLTWDLPTERSKSYYSDKLKREVRDKCKPGSLPNPHVLQWSI